jgi:pimeloyl-ACP methyl ester carboxylesterase
LTPLLSFHLGLSMKGFHRVAYWTWGDDRAERTVICAHGLSRQGRDFDQLALRLVRQGFRVVCPDLAGRGRSDWLADPAEYTALQYGADMNALIARLEVEEVDWLGNSLGGIVGMMLAAQPNTPIRRLVLNDIGPFIPGSALRRLGAYLNAPPPHFADFAEAEQYFRTTLAPFGDLTAEDWHHITEHSIRPGPDGTLVRHHDPAIGLTYKPWYLSSLVMWDLWDRVRCPVLLLRGALSDMLLPDTAHSMTRRGPKASLVEFDGIGHLPALMHDDQIAPVVEFLMNTW